jgi:hypothetical protein
MIGEINRKKEDGRLISYFGFTPPKVLRIFAEYRRLYPNGRLHISALAVFAIAMVALIVVDVLYLKVGVGRPGACTLCNLRGTRGPMTVQRCRTPPVV